jgi:hypothetical protein
MKHEENLVVGQTPVTAEPYFEDQCSLHGHHQTADDLWSPSRGVVVQRRELENDYPPGRSAGREDKVVVHYH